MAEKKRHIDELLRDGLGNYTEQPPVGAWANMESRLDESEDMDIFFGEILAGKEMLPPADAWTKMEARLDEQGHGRRRRKWYWLAAALAGLLLGSYVLLDGRREHTAVTEQTQVEAGTSPDAFIPAEENIPAETAPSAPVEKEETEKEAPRAEQGPAMPKSNVAQHKAEPQATPMQKTAEVKKDAPVADNNIPAEKNSVAQQQEVPAKAETAPEQETIQTPVAAITDSIKDDVAAAMKKRETDVLMNIKRSAYSDSVEAAEQQRKEETLLAVRKDSIEQETPAIGNTTDSTSQPVVAIAQSADTLISGVAQTLADKAKEKTEQPVKAIEAVQDAIVPASQAAQTPPDKLVFTETDAMKEKIAAMVDNGTDKGSLETFIGPLEDTVNYQMEIAALTAAAEEDKIKEPIRADIIFKAGYERGFDRYSISKFVVAPSFEVKLADRLSLMLQPALKVGSSNRKEIGHTISYHDITESYTDSLTKFKLTHNSVTGIPIDSIYTNYYFKEVYDSVVVSHSFDKRTVVQVDMPLMISYKVSKNVSVYGGPVVSYSTVPNINTNITRYRGGILRDTILKGNVKMEDVLSKEEVKAENPFEYNTKNYNEYNGRPYANPTGNKLNMGAMAGVTMNVNKLSVDLSLMQNFSGMNYIPNAGVRNLYLQPYVRFMLGYKLYSNKK